MKINRESKAGEISMQNYSVKRSMMDMNLSSFTLFVHTTHAHPPTHIHSLSISHTPKTQIYI